MQTIYLKNKTTYMKQLIEFIFDLAVVVVLALGLLTLQFKHQLKQQREDKQTVWVKAQIELNKQDKNAGNGNT